MSIVGIDVIFNTIIKTLRKITESRKVKEFVMPYWELWIMMIVYIIAIITGVENVEDIEDVEIISIIVFVVVTLYFLRGLDRAAYFKCRSIRIISWIAFYVLFLSIPLDVFLSLPCFQDGILSYLFSDPNPVIIAVLTVFAFIFVWLILVANFHPKGGREI